MLKKLIKLYIQRAIDDFLQEVMQEFALDHDEVELAAIQDFIDIVSKKLIEKMEEINNGLQEI